MGGRKKTTKLPGDEKSLRDKSRVVATVGGCPDLVWNYLRIVGVAGDVVRSAALTARQTAYWRGSCHEPGVIGVGT